MFADRYFGKRYFPNRYFPTAAESAVIAHPVGGDGGFYRRPIKYVRDGKVVDLNEPPAIAPEIVAPPFELTPEVVAALMARMGVPVSNLPGLVDGLDARMGRMLMERELAAMADDDEAVLLLLAS
ncbi:hypothetical protein [Mesorhizobium sp. CO1-1-9]|uniref:hypothetical protein n=1 Tax=Mesorhizobium sp. CO1-1-9 TaxID=2876630 RepID=UPI001CCF9EF6|nr:hypothetical protein [Mesorhizobium sp. CO1-1-9]MBZ9693931.1 hypothetical protein [Mesorhizobium sp. CO1-1-9]